MTPLAALLELLRQRLAAVDYLRAEDLLRAALRDAAAITPEKE